MLVSKRDCRAPSLARSPLMKARAESTVLSASVALVKVVTSRLATLCSEEPPLSSWLLAEVTAKDFSESSVM